MTGTLLACPVCGNTALWSDEAAAIMYPVRMYRDAAGIVSPDYTGASYLVMDEGTTYRGEVWCRDCGNAVLPAELVPAGTIRGQSAPHGATPDHTPPDAEAPESGPPERPGT